MIANLLLMAAVVQGGTVTYRDVPVSVQRIQTYEWRAEGPSEVAASIERVGARVTIHARGANAVVMMFTSDGQYLIDGPFRWPDANQERSIDPRWRRTLGAELSPAGEAEEIAWLSASSGGAWPRCVRSNVRVTCVGVPAGEVGIALAKTGDRLWWSVVGRGMAAFRSSRWGRLILVRGAAVDSPGTTGMRSAIQVRIQYPVVSSQRTRSVRLDTADVPHAASVVLGRAALWVAGEEVPDQAWAEIRAGGDGPSYLSLREVADDGVAGAVGVTLEEARSVEGDVFGDAHAPAAGALITLFRILEARPDAPHDKEPPKKVFVAETTADDRGGVRLEGLGDARYEVVAWHPQFGRAALAIDATQSRIDIRLQSAGVIRGRVFVNGKPTGGVDVMGVPDPDAARAAEDLFDVKGGDTRSGGDGRFVVFAAARGGELRVGGGRYPVKRLLLPRGAEGSIDVGDIELGGAIVISVVLNDDPACVVRAAGPVGRTGLQIVAGVRTAPGIHSLALPEAGMWEFGLLCGSEERALSPSVKEIAPELSGKEVRFLVR